MRSLVSGRIDKAIGTTSLFSTDEFIDDALWAVLIGIALGLVILSILTVFPGTTKDIQPSVSGDSSTSHTYRTTKLSDSESQNIQNESIPILHILNTFVYLFLFSGTVYYLNRDYDDIATKWFIRMFPREAE